MNHTYPIVLHDFNSRTWLKFENPCQIISTTRLDQVIPRLKDVEDLVNTHDWFAVGFISYEAAPAFDPAAQVRPDDGFPLLWFGLYSAVQQMDSLPTPNPGYQLDKWRPTISRETYDKAIDQIKNQIAAGNTYQVNYTFRLRNTFSGDPWSLFADMVQSQGAGYSAYLDLGPRVICSASPELFFTLDKQTITCRPMKGTIKRAPTLAKDKKQADFLQHSTKNRAENVMIVDMIRNDLGRLAKTGSVRVPELFTVERYPTLWQMTSSVSAESDAPFTLILQNLFPCASITGAPKISTMNIIAQLETTPRRVYTGAIGYLAPHRKAQFNVAIRTVLIDRQQQQAEYGLGGGVVWDSTRGGEYAEALLKARVLNERRPDFSLLETIRWSHPDGFALLPDHLQRLKNSAEYFDFRCDQEEIMHALNAALSGFTAPAYRLRLLLDRHGRIDLQTSPLENADPTRPLRLKIAAGPIRSDTIFLYHKTSLRAVYEKARASQSDCDDVILYNEKGEVTETSIANLVFELQGQFYTPAESCGLLPGTYRAQLIRQGKIREKIIKLTDLPAFERVIRINSVRGWQPAQII